jgi:hypothetical protein
MSAAITTGAGPAALTSKLKGYLFLHAGWPEAGEGFPNVLVLVPDRSREPSWLLRSRQHAPGDGTGKLTALRCSRRPRSW